VDAARPNRVLGEGQFPRRFLCGLWPGKGKRGSLVEISRCLPAQGGIHVRPPLRFGDEIRVDL
jgi:hypothetical protein